MTQPTRGRITLRTAGASDAKKLYALIQANLEEGHLLPRTLGELTVHAERFVVAVKARKIVGCAELAPLSPHVAEVRSLAVDSAARGSRVGVMIVDELRLRARREGYEKLCAFTHAPRYFIPMHGEYRQLFRHAYQRNGHHRQHVVMPRRLAYPSGAVVPGNE